MNKRGNSPRPGKAPARAKGAPAKPAAEHPGGSEAGAPALVRLNKFLADHGVASRRAADELIAAGEVQVDGAVVTELGTRIDPGAQSVEVKGEVLAADATRRRRYYLLNKPPGVVCTNDVRETRPRAVDLVTDRDKGRIYTVGRLDEESKGLILLTNDGDFANRVMHPRYGVPKTYLVKLRGRIDDEALQKVREGVHLSDGRTGGARVVVRKRTRDYTHLIVTLREGKNREIRRVFARVGAKVVDLRRARIGNLTDRGLRLGSWRPLTRAEVRDLLDPSTEEEPEREERGGARRRPAERAPKGPADRRPRRKKKTSRRPEGTGTKGRSKPPGGRGRS